MIIDTKAVEFLVTCAPGAVLVRWLEPLGRPNTGLYQVLYEVLSEIDGVEQVTMHRYTALLTVADHVLEVEQVAQHVFDALTSDPEIRFSVTFQLDKPVDVKFAGACVRL